MNNKKYVILMISSLVILVVLIIGVTYAIFNYTKTGEMNKISTGQISFDISNSLSIDVSNDFPKNSNLSNEDMELMKESHKGTLSVTSNTSFQNGIEYKIYAVKGEDIAGKIRLKDDNIKFQFVPRFTSGQNGFTIQSNSYATPSNLSFGNNERILISTGLVKDVSELTTVSYDYYMWIDDTNILISSTTKRATLPEGNPSLADTTTGNVIVGRYMKNTSQLTNITLYPADVEQTGKIVYTTNEFSNGFYNISIIVEAEDARS